MVESVSLNIEKPSPKTKNASRKRKKKTKSPVEAKSLKLDDAETLPTVKQNAGTQKVECPPVMFEGLSMEEIGERFPVLKNEELVKKFLGVTLTNNQKGRIRTLLRDNLKGTSGQLEPDVINSRIQAVLKSSENLTDADLRKLRILYNMLKTAVAEENAAKAKKHADKKNADKKKTQKANVKDGDGAEEKTEKKQKIKTEKPEKTGKLEKSEKKEQLVQKVKGKKRYVVFLGNLPLGIDKDKIMGHFSELNEHIVDIRIPKPKPDSKSAIAYVELRNEPTYELALSNHHSMLGNKRINVLYTTQQKTKISKTEAKSKSAKLVALQRSGALAGSTAINKKRSARRLKMKKARAAAENA